MKNLITLITLLIFINNAQAQTTVDYLSNIWKDFGTTNAIGLTGNFLPGWSSVSGTPDYSKGNLFNIPHQTLSGANNDAGLWFQTSTGWEETHSLSLNNLTIGNDYTITFNATVLQDTRALWAGTSGTILVELI